MIVKPSQPGLFEFSLQLLSKRLHFEVGNANVGSIELIANNADGFDSGVLTLGKTNSLNTVPTALSTPQTITAPVYVEIGGTDWCKARYLTLEVTTPSTTPRSISGTLQLKSLILN